MIIWIIYIPWAVIFLFWTVTMFFSNKRIESGGFLGGRIENLLLVAVPILCLFYLCRLVFFNTIIIPQIWISEAVGFVVAASGVVLGIWARIVLGRNWSADVSFKKGQRLVTSGPYAIIRHPIYTAFLLLTLGSAIYLGFLSGFIGLVIGFFGAVLKLKKEEALMTKHFQKDYPKYKKRTKALIPYVY